MSGLSIEIKMEWDKVQTDVSNCANCEEMIVSSMYELVVFMNNELCEKGTEIKICESCYQLINDQ